MEFYVCLTCYDRPEFSSELDFRRHELLPDHRITYISKFFEFYRNKWCLDNFRDISVNCPLMRSSDGKRYIEMRCDNHDGHSVETFITIRHERCSPYEHGVRLHGFTLPITSASLAIADDKDLSTSEETSSHLLRKGEEYTFLVTYRADRPIDMSVAVVLTFEVEGDSSRDLIFIGFDIRLICQPYNLTGGAEFRILPDGADFARLEPCIDVIRAPRDKAKGLNPDAIDRPQLKRFTMPEKLARIIEMIKANMRLRTVRAASELGEITLEDCDEVKRYLRMPPEANITLYSGKFHLLLFLEEQQQRFELEKFSLVNVKIEGKSSRTDFYYEIALPGLDQKRPSVSSGTRFFIREDPDSIREFEGRVVRIFNSRVSLEFHPCFDRVFNEHRLYCIRIGYCRMNMEAMHNAVDTAGPVINDVLFPTATDRQLRGDVVIQRWFDKNIAKNAEQKQSVIQILTGNYFPAPYVVFGPPGTGKTSTIAEAIKQVVAKGGEGYILVCASSNSACDVITMKLLEHIEPRLIRRIYSRSYDMHRLPQAISNASYRSAHGNFDHPIHNLTRGEGGMFLESHITSGQVIISTLTTAIRFGSLNEFDVKYLFIDECAYSQEPESLIPIAYLAAKDCFPRIILSGDNKQLGPIIWSYMAKSGGLEESLLSRLMEADVYRRHEHGYNKRFITKLLKNYRSHPKILHIPNQLFYEGELIAAGDANVCNRFVAYRKLKKQGVPVVFHAINCEERKDPNNASYYNEAEISAVLDYVKDLVNTEKVLQKDIGIITPYAAQVRRMGHALRLHRYNDIKVGSVEEFQGQERLVIILSTVRNTANLLKLDLRHRLGFIRNEKRFNVAITRAKALLIVVGNPRVLCEDKTWHTFIDYCVTEGALDDAVVLR